MNPTTVPVELTGRAIEGLIFDQVHLGVPDPEAAARWYRQYLGAAPGDHGDRVMLGSTRFIFLKNDAPTPSHGAAIDHVGLSCVDLGARVAGLVGSGARVTAPVGEVEGLYGSCLVEDPWGASIEIVDRAPFGVHHVQLRVPDPALARRWYIEMFGGQTETLGGRLAGVRCGGALLLLDRGEAAPSRDHTIDHIGWRMSDLLAAAARLKTQGASFTVEPKPGPGGIHAPVLMSFMEDPWGVKIELLQRPPD